MGYYTAFGLGIVLMCVSVVGHDVFPAWFNLHGNAAVLAAHGLVISSTAFVLLGDPGGRYYYQATGKITDSSLLIYGDAFVALPLCLFALPLWFGLDGVWLAMPVSACCCFCSSVTCGSAGKTPAVQNAAFFCPPVKFHEAQCNT